MVVLDNQFDAAILRGSSEAFRNLPGKLGLFVLRGVADARLSDLLQPRKRSKADGLHPLDDAGPLQTQK